MEERTTISTFEDGPVLVTGGVFRVVDTEGGELPVDRRPSPCAAAGPL
jgi:hypothetical protein